MTLRRYPHFQKLVLETYGGWLAFAFIKEFVEVPQQFVREGNQFLARCTKPSWKEFIQISRAVAVGFAVMGFIGYFVKLIHIPINNILVGGA